MLKSKYFHGPRLRCLNEEHEIKNGSSISKICKKVMPLFKSELYWIPGNGKLIRLWQDAILGQPPPNLPRLQNWMTALGLKMIWDISEWENDESNRWVGWTLPKFPSELNTEKNMLLSHLIELAPLNKTTKDKRGWGRSSGRYSAAEGYQRFSTNYNVPENPEI